MLDVLEKFLSYHAVTYSRLDGSTKPEARIQIMEQFNRDPKIFCMILSTRSGGIGVNLTGADTVIFYDSDWNPTIDAQAQDRLVQEEMRPYSRISWDNSYYSGKIQIAK